VRSLLIVIAAAAAACNSNPAAGSGGASAAPTDTAREQARFDQERNPRKVVEALKIGPGSRVADVGAGSGLLTIHLARAVGPTGRVVATDIDSLVLELLHQRMVAAGLAEQVERRVVSADDPELEDGSYDAILLAEVDHYFADEVSWLRAATRALRPTGRIVISNRIQHRPRSMKAAKGAGLSLETESAPVPTHFIAVFVPPSAPSKPAGAGAR
jgi:ubiquinone/menaquinone biosynthesis C-methylase UbiE